MDRNAQAIEVEGTVHVSDMFRSSQREAIVEFSEPFAIMHDQFYARRGSDIRCALGNLDGKEVIVEEASFTYEHLAREEKGAKLIRVERSLLHYGGCLRASTTARWLPRL